MNPLERIEESILAESKELFESPELRKTLHVTIRIIGAFRDFLLRFGPQPPAEELDYMMGTIRSGIDGFFGLAYVCNTIELGKDNRQFDSQLHWDFPALREDFLREFEQLVNSPDRSAATKLVALLALTRLELIFLGQNFPSAIFAVTSSQVENNEFVSDLSEWQAGRLSLDEVSARAMARRYKGKS